MMLLGYATLFFIQVGGYTTISDVKQHSQIELIFACAKAHFQTVHYCDQ